MNVRSKQQTMIMLTIDIKSPWVGFKLWNNAGFVYSSSLPTDRAKTEKHSITPVTLIDRKVMARNG